MAAGEGERNYCNGGGGTVGAHREVPERAEEFIWPSVQIPIFGCNNVRCRTCGARTRNRPALTLGYGDWTDLAARLFAAEDWQPFIDANELVSDPNIRFYVCRCQWFQAAGQALLTDPYFDAIDPAPTSWACHGHPRVALPLELDGERIAEDTDWTELVRGAFAGTRARARPGYLQWDKAHWVERLYFELQHTPFAPAVVEAVRQALGDADAVVAGAARGFWQRVDPKPGRPPGN